MGRKSRTTTLEERILIAERASAGHRSVDIADEIGCSLATVRKWRQRHTRLGRNGLSSQMGRPAAGALATVSTEIKAALLEMRDQHPRWGPKTLHSELTNDTRFREERIPSWSRIAAYLKEQKKVRQYEAHQELPNAEVQKVQRPHQEWEMDAQGVTTVKGLGKVSFINLLDVYSHVSIDSHACHKSSHPKAEEYQRLLRRAFERYGLPEQISLDHDSAFMDNKSGSPFPSLIHLWLLGLGVEVRFIKKPPPLEHARIERHHQTLAWQAHEGQSFDSVTELQRRLQARLLFLNQAYPTKALDEQPPLQAFPQARHSGRVFRHQEEADFLDMGRVDAYLKTARWFRKVSSVGTFSVGGHQYYADAHLAGQTLEITFQEATRALVCLPEKSNQIFYIEIKGLTKAALMGKNERLPAFAAFQLALPFSYPDTTL